MRVRSGQITIWLTVIVGCCLGFVPQAAAHAALLAASPAQAANVATAPTHLDLHYDEEIEPRFAVLSVTDVNAKQHATGTPYHPSGELQNVDAHLANMTPGWYLVYWRVISADGHPVAGFYTFSVGADPGPPPTFPTPSTNESAATPGLVTVRALALLLVVVSLGMVFMRLVIARTPVAGGRRILRHVSHVGNASFVAAFVMIAVYLEKSTALFAQRSFWKVGTIFPLIRVSSFGRAWSDELYVLAGTFVCWLIAIWLDDPERRRTQAGSLANLGVLLGSASAILILGLAGHPAQTSPVWLSMILDWFHVAAVSVWFGGLVAIPYLALVLRDDDRRSALTAIVPRFSRAAFVSVLLIFATGIGATIVHMPTLDALWDTGYGIAILVKFGLLVLLMPIALVNRSHHTPALGLDDLVRRDVAVRTLPRLVTAELVGGVVIIVVAAVLTSLPPPVNALATYDSPLARLGPGTVTDHVIHDAGYDIHVSVGPNKAVENNTYQVRVEKDGKPAPGASVRIIFQHLQMQMEPIKYQLTMGADGTATRTAPAFIMAGKWGIQLSVSIPGHTPLTIPIQDEVNG